MKKPKIVKLSKTLRIKRAELDRLQKEGVSEARLAHVERQIARLIPLVEAETCKLYS